MKNRLGLLLFLVFWAVISRVVPHPWNWTAIGSVALLGGARLPKVWQAVTVPLIALLISDSILGFHDQMILVYGAFALSSLLAFIFRDQMSGPRLVGASIVSTLIFYFVTNFGVWWAGAFYPMSFDGLVTCYIAGLPFLARQVSGDIFYTLAFFILWDGLEVRLTRAASAKKLSE